VNTRAVLSQGAGGSACGTVAESRTGAGTEKVVSQPGDDVDQSEDHLQEQRESINDLLSSTLKTERPVSMEKLFLYYRRVCLFLDMLEGRIMVSSHVTMDQLDILLSVLPAAESFLWGRHGRNVHLEDTQDMFYEFCMEHAEELKSQVLSPRGADKTAQASATPHNESCWKGRVYWGSSVEKATCQRCVSCSRQ
jgi:hypothetical protein